MGEAPKGPLVPRPTGEAGVVDTSDDEADNIIQPAEHGKSSSKTTALASDSDEGSSGSELTRSSVTTVTTATFAGLESSSSGDDSVANAQGHLLIVAGSRAASMTKAASIQGSPPSKKESISKGKATKFAESSNAKPVRLKSDHQDDLARDEEEKIHKRTSIRWKSLHRAKIAKDYTTSESEDEDEVLEKQQVINHHLEPIKSSTNAAGNSSFLENDDDGNPYTTDVESNYDSDDEDDEHNAKRRRIHNSLKTSTSNEPPYSQRARELKFADEEEVSNPPGISARQYSRSDAESRDADHELWEEEDENDDDASPRRRLKRINHGNSASFSGGVSRNFRWSNVKTKIFYSFRAKGQDSDDEGSKVIAVRNLACKVTEQNLHQFFDGAGTVTRVKIITDEYGRCTGSAYVEFESGAAARKGMQKTGTKLLERVVFCDVAHEAGGFKPVSKDRPSSPPQAATEGEKHFIFKLKGFHRDGEESVRPRMFRSSEPSKSTENIFRSTGSSNSGRHEVDNTLAQENSTSGDSTRGGKSSGAIKKLLGFSKSSSDSQKHGSQSRGVTPIPEIQSRGLLPPTPLGSEHKHEHILSIESHSHGRIETTNRSISIPSPSEPYPTATLEEALSLGGSSTKRRTKKKKWSWGKWRRKHRGWSKLWWPWVKKSRLHWWHFANLSSCWGKARRSSVKDTQSRLEAADKSSKSAAAA